MLQGSGRADRHMIVAGKVAAELKAAASEGAVRPSNGASGLPQREHLAFKPRDAGDQRVL